MTAPGIAVYSTAAVVSQAEVKAGVEACSAQLTEDFCPAWGKLPITATYFANPKDIPEGMPTILVADECDDPQALAYHTEQTDGRITGLVGAKTCIDAGETWTSALSHELLETARDPFVNDWTTMTGHAGKRKVATEVCDPVQDGSYKKNGVEVSSFVLPAWFDDSPPAGAKFDWLGTLTAPFTRTSGGYFVTDTAGKVTQEGMRPKHKSKHGRGARRMGA